MLHVKPGLRKAPTFPEELQKSVLDSFLGLCGVKMNKCHTVLETGLPASGPPLPGPGSSPSSPLSRSWEVPTPHPGQRPRFRPSSIQPWPNVVKKPICNARISLNANEFPFGISDKSHPLAIIFCTAPKYRWVCSKYAAPNNNFHTC